MHVPVQISCPGGTTVTHQSVRLGPNIYTTSHKLSLLTSKSSAPTVTCIGCYIAMATSSGSDQAVAGMGTVPSVKSSQANVDTTDIVLTAYSITSVYMSDGVCITTSGVPVSLTESYYTVTDPTGVPSSDFPTYAASQFVNNFLGISTCVGSGEEFFPTALIQVNDTSVTPALSTLVLPAPSASLPVGANSTTSTILHPSNATKSTVAPRLDEPIKIGIGVGVSFAALLLISLVGYIWRKRRLHLAAITAEEQGDTEGRQKGTSSSDSDNQPYLQQKAELEAEERQRHELEARQKIHELDGGTEIREVPGGTHEHRLAVMRSKQELTSGEHSQELDA